MVSSSAKMKLTDEGIEPHLDTYDEGTGILLELVPRPYLCIPEEEYGKLWYVAVIDGRFDSHRNDLGRLAVWEHELELI